MVDKVSRQEAVDYAKAELRSHEKAWWKPSDEGLAEGPSIYAWMASGLAGWSGYKPIEGGSPYTLEKIDFLLNQALSNSVAFDAVSLIVADFEYRRQPMPEGLRDWAVAVKQDRILRPKMKRGKIRERYFFRNVVVHQLLQEIVKFGFKSTRDDGSDHKDSACDIVAEAMEEVGDSGIKAIDYDRIKDIWEQLNKGGRR